MLFNVHGIWASMIDAAKIACFTVVCDTGGHNYHNKTATE